MDFTGVYRNQLRPDDPARTLAFMPIMWSSTNDSGEVSVSFEGPGKALLRLSRYEFNVPERCRMMEGYLMEVVTMSSGREPRAGHPECAARGANDCVWRVSWSRELVRP
jgi:hypothetical protein